MSEVERFTSSKNNISRHVKGQAIVTTDFVMVMASDYDAALARKAASRAELDRCGSMAAMIENKEWAEHAGTGPVSSRVESAFTQLHNELAEAQQRLTDAEKRCGELESAAREMLRIAGIAKQGSNAYNRAIINLNAALKPLEGEGS